MLGTSIQSPGDPMRKIQEQELYRGIKSPKEAHIARIRQLRVAYQIDPKQYAQLKRSLPYVVCGMFNPPYRRTENFGYIESFIIDIDHLASKGISPGELRKSLQTDPRVMMCFTSPSEDGLKLMFRLQDKCHDHSLYSLFYKEFLRRFSQQYQLEQVADTRTSDVTRACFVSYDPEAYMNEQCEAIDMFEYVNTSDTTSLFDLMAAQQKAEKEAKKAGVAVADTKPHDPDIEAMEKIKQRLNPNGRQQKVKPEAYVPPQLVEIMEDLKRYIEDSGLIVTEIQSIQYGQKIRMKMGLKQAEINLFFGKRGFSVVKSPRCGTNAELNDICSTLIQNFIDTQ